MDINKFTESERLCFVKLYTDMTKIVLEDIVIEKDFAEQQITRINTLVRSRALTDSEIQSYNILLSVFQQYTTKSGVQDN